MTLDFTSVTSVIGNKSLGVICCWVACLLQPVCLAAVCMMYPQPAVAVAMIFTEDCASQFSYFGW